MIKVITCARRSGKSYLMNELFYKHLLDAIAFDHYTLGYYEVGNRVGNAFKDGLKLKK